MKSIVNLILILAAHTTFAQTGIIWSQTADVASSQFGNMHPRVVIDGAGDPMILWGKGNANQVFFTHWTGNSFASPVAMNPNTIPVFAASWAGPDLASRGDTVYVVFKQTPEDANNIYLVHSFDGGVNFSAPVSVDAIADSISRFPTVSVDAKGNPVVAFMKFNPDWTNARFVLAKSEDQGNSFSTDVLGSGYSGGEVCSCCPASLATDGNTTALLYRNNLNNLRNSWASISYDGGNSFGGGIEIDNTDWIINACPATGPDGVIVGNSLYSVFMSAASGKSLCYRSHSNLNTQQLEMLEPLTENVAGLAQQNYPRIATSGEAAAIVWTQTVNGDAQLGFQFTNNISNGYSPGYEILVPNNVVSADVAFSATKIYVVWEDLSSGKVKIKSGSYISSGASDLSNTSGSFQIFPNPASSSGLYVQFDVPDASRVNYKIFNTQGQQLVSGVGAATDVGLKMDVSSLSSGIYFIRISHHGQVEFRKVIL